MLKKLAFLAILVVVLAVAYGAAASLTVNSKVVQGGNSSALTCDPDGVVVDYNTNVVTTSEYPDNNPYGTVTSVNISGIDSACVGKRLMVRVDDINGNMIGFGGAVYGGPSDYCTSIYPGSVTIASANEKMGLFRTTEDMSCLMPSYGVPDNLIERVVVWIEG